MSYKANFFTVFFVFHMLLVGSAFAQDSCMTGECHGEGKFKITLHPDEIECQDCHEQLVESHPAKKLKNFKLLDNNICSDCHDDIAENKLNHKPVAEGKCFSCHSPHGDMSKKLVVKKYTAKPFVDYTTDSYQLCFKCHARDLLRFPDTSFSTEFRHGDSEDFCLHL